MPKKSNWTRLGATRIRPELCKKPYSVMLWPDYRDELQKVGQGSVSAGIAVLVAQHLKKSGSRSRAA